MTQEECINQLDRLITRAAGAKSLLLMNLTKYDTGYFYNPELYDMILGEFLIRDTSIHPVHVEDPELH